MITALLATIVVIASAPSSFCRLSWSTATSESLVVLSGGRVDGFSWVGSSTRFGGGVTVGSVATRQGSWPVCSDIPVGFAGSQSLTVASGKTGSLAGGRYGTVVVKSGATLTLPGSGYSFARLELGSGAKLLLTSSKEVDVRVVGLVWASGAQWIRSSVTPTNFRLWLPTASSLDIPSGSVLPGTLIAPSALVRVLSGARVEGAVWSRRLEVHSGSRIHGNAWKPSVEITVPRMDSVIDSSAAHVTWTVAGFSQSQQGIESLPDTGSHWITRCAWGACDSIKVRRASSERQVQVKILEPAPGFLTNRRVIPVTWSVDSAVFRDSAVLIEERNTIKRCSSGVCDSVSGDLDTQPPSVRIVSPSSGFATRDPILPIRWTIDGTVRSDLETLREGSNLVVRQGVDAAGNQGSDTIQVTLDRIGPEVYIESPAPGSIVQTARTPVAWTVDGSLRIDTAALVEGVNFIVRSAQDSLGNTSSDSVAIWLDATEPQGSWILPADSLRQRSESLSVVIAGQDDLAGIATWTLILDGSERSDLLQINSTGDTAEAVLVLSRGWHTLEVRLSDRAGNSVLLPYRRVLVGVAQSPIHIETPAPLAMLKTLDATVSGRVDVDLTEFDINGVPANISGGRFSGVVGLLEGRNTITVSGFDASGDLQQATVTVVVDRTAPDLRIEFPTVGAVLTQPIVDVSGSVSDRILSMAQAAQTGVKINGDSVVVENSSFRGRVVLVPGENVLNAVATDAFGNQSGRSVRVVYDPSAVYSLQRVCAGSNCLDLQGRVREFLPDSVRVRLTDRDGAPSVGDTLVYRVVQGSGVISGDLDSGSRVGMAITNAQGEANLSWRLGRRSGPGANRLQVEGLRGRGQLFLSATAQGDSLVRLQISGGDHQRGLAGSPAPWPVVALVTDTLNNPLEGEAVTFQATRGGGHFGGYDTITVMTGADGKATALWTLGETTIPEGQVVEAYLRRPRGLDLVADSVDALFGTLSVSSRMRSLPAVFRATALKGGPIESTTVTGVVLDNQNDPLPGVTVILEELGLRTVTDETGHFRISAMVSGIRHLKVIGATSTRPGKWVSLHFEINIVSGVENHLGMPIYLLSENERPESAKRPRVDSAVTLTVAEVPGFSLTVPQGSARFPFEWDDARRVVSVTPVHLDKIPMPPGEGMQPVVVVSIQPMDVKFDIPAPVTFPNVDRLPPGEQTNMYSFDHDLGTFVKIGTGTVSEDGSVIVSDPGYGIVHGGWHCAGPSNSTGSAEAPKVDLRIDSPKPYRKLRDICFVADCAPNDGVFSANASGAGAYISTPIGFGDGRASFCVKAQEPGKVTVQGNWICKSGQRARDVEEFEIFDNEVVIDQTDIVKDEGSITLIGQGKGALKIELITDEEKSEVLKEIPVATEGTISFSMKRKDLPEGKYTTVAAKWTLESGDEVEDKKSVSFRVLGKYRHTRYNTPDESKCGGTSTALRIVSHPACRLDANAFEERRSVSRFWDETFENGTGKMTGVGYVKPDAICWKPCDLVSGKRLRRVDFPRGVKGDRVTDQTVAFAPGHLYIDFGSRIFIEGFGIKTAVDYCPACRDNDSHHLDNWTSSAECVSHAFPDLSPSTLQTILLE